MDKIVKASLPLSISLFIIAFSVITTLEFKKLYYWEIEHLAIEQSAHLSKDKIKENYDVLIDYLTDKKITKLEFPSFGMSKEGEIHFHEVKNIFMAIKNIMIITGIYSFIGLVICISKKYYKFLKQSGILTLLIPTVLSLLVSIDFDKSFVLFHKLFFNNDFWIFDPVTDPIIMILPQDFFMHSFFLIIIIIITIAIILFTIYSLLSKK